MKNFRTIKRRSNRRTKDKTRSSIFFNALALQKPFRLEERNGQDTSEKVGDQL